MKTKIKNLQYGRILIASFLIVQMFFGYVAALHPQTAYAALNNNSGVANTTNANGTTQINVPKYEGVDQSIKEYLCVPPETNETAGLGTSLFDCIGKAYRFGIAFGAIALVFFVVLAGYFYITGGEQGKGKGKTMFTTALVGMAIILSSYVLLRFINPNLVIIKPIQPPIFSASDLPRCEEVGFQGNCVLPSGQVQAGGGGGGTAGSASEAQWKDLITKHSAILPLAPGDKYCALSALMEKESTYNKLAVSNGPPRQVDTSHPNKQVYNITDFDSKYHAVGLIQITIYERRRGLAQGWTNGVPARDGAEFGFSRPLYVTDLIDPETNVKAGSHFFAAKIRQANGDLYQAYRRYQGLKSAPATLNKYMDMYAACKRRG